ncbi:MAG: hypothetical protein EA365_03345 [Gloeocapsa sp. DLM2.Bin57]|nr:MAG: hypothetical protein EA365_03345 [Gloeocapsa sp. DLM2.Bin57]
MQPKFKNQLTWSQAELLMQPILIRVIDNLRQSLETSSWKGTYQEIQHPYPGYQLSLTKDEEVVNLDIWQLCFQVCFLNYQYGLTEDYIEIDTNLITAKGEVNWTNLETKTKQIIQDIFNDL